jgi:sugar lactone lactonase YvrE
MSTKSFVLAALALAGCTDDAKPQPAMLALPGNSYYPESLHAGSDGTLYVGSLVTGEVVAFHDGDATPHPVIAAGANGVTGETGVHVIGDELWICKVDTMTFATEVRSFGLDGTPHATYALAPNAFCNDLEPDGEGNIYATDSFTGTIQRLSPGAASFETWISDPRFVPATQGAFGLDGIAYDGHGALYVNKLDTSELFRIDLASKQITPITVTPALSHPDGMRLVDAHTLLVVDGGANRLSKVSVTDATATSISLDDSLDMPTAVVVARGSAWVTDGQIGRLFANPPQAPNLPFEVVRVKL